MNMHNAGGTQPPRTAKLDFLTVTTGHTMTMSRAATADDIIELLRPIVLAGRGHAFGWDIQMVLGAAGGAAGFTLKRDGHFLTCSYVAWTEEGAAEFWPIIQQVAGFGFGAAVTERPACLPWLAAVIMPCAPEAIPLLFETASLECSLAWTILETLGGGTPTPPSGPNDFDWVQDIGAGIAAFVRGTNAGASSIRLPQDGATLAIGPEGLTMYVQFSDPTKAEVADLRRGKLDIGIVSVGGTGILLTRFGAAADTPRFPAKSPIVLECPYHIGLLPPDRRYLPQRAGGLSLALTIVVQNQYGTQHGARHIGLAIPTVEAIERIVAKQAEEAARTGWTRAAHDAEVARFYGQTPDLARAADRLFAKAWARETVQ